MNYGSNNARPLVLAAGHETRQRLRPEANSPPGSVGLHSFQNLQKMGFSKKFHKSPADANTIVLAPEAIMHTRKPAKAKGPKTEAPAKPPENQEIVAKGAELPVVAESEAPATGFPIVGIGASAGGLAAFEAFFSGMPTNTDPGMAFVLVQHLAPDHKSVLTDLIQRYTRMQVFEVEDGMVVKPNCAYIIPPGRDMAFHNGTLQLLEPSAPRGQRLPIDFFFRSLAQDQRERAICIVLSGTGSDGTQGVRAIKGEGGMAMAQNPDSTEYDGMPNNAIATGLVDYELLPAEMPAQLIAYAAHAFGKTPLPSTLPAAQVESALQKIFTLLRAQTGHDFSQYKTNTIQRRIERRMAVHQLEKIDGYVAYLQQKPAEVEALLRDLLIGVTSFFRDPETFKKLEEQVIPKLFNGKPEGAAIRVWSVGCSTGEEAYSLAILLQERMAILKRSYKVQVFATDIDRQSIATARAGLYPGSIAADLSPERLARFFTVEHDGSSYRIHKNIRDMLIFSEQNVIKDPPFSKINLISCRNVLIYMGKQLQKKLIPLFHYALNPDGFLFLGSSETIGEYNDLFSTLDRKLKLYQHKKNLHGAQHAVLGRYLPTMTAKGAAFPLVAGKPAVAGKLSLRELTERAFLQELAPTGALVNSNGDILYLHGRTGMYLEPGTGEVGVYNILKMAREGLRYELTTALHKAVETNQIVRCTGLRVKTNGDFSTVTLTIHPVVAGPATPPDTPLYLVILEELAAVEQPEQTPVEEGAERPDTPAELSASVHIAALRQELRAKEEYLQSANEDLETSNEELTSTNEEMQLINEELATVNAELQTKVADLSRANNDMNNLLSGTNIATVFVDHQLRILRFTPTATRIINLIPSDVGRPIGHTVSNLAGYDRMVADVRSVLDTLVPCEVEVQTLEGKWYTMRIQPYITIDNVIEGAVLTFVDISEVKKMHEVLNNSEEQRRQAQEVINAQLREHAENLTSIYEALDSVGLIICDLEEGDAHIASFNPGVEKMLGYRPEEAIGKSIMLFHSPEFQDILQDRVTRLRQGEMLHTMDMTLVRKSGEQFPAIVSVHPFANHEGRFSKAVGVFRDVSDLMRMQEELRATNDKLELRVEQRTEELQKLQKQYLHAERLSAIGKLSASIAHEFNSPLQGILSILKGVTKRAIMEDEDKALLDAAISECDRIKNLIRNLSEFNRPSSGKKLMVDVHKSLDSMLLLQSNDFRGRRLSVVRNYAEELPRILAVPDQLKQVFLNLLANAADACPPSGGEITVSTWQEDKRVAVAIKDTGIGIKPEDRERIFQPFFSTKPAVKGTGLGLSVCHGIIEHHQGEIRVESQPGEGSTFTVLLPIQGDSDAA